MTAVQECPDCHGSGEVSIVVGRDWDEPFYGETRYVECPLCHGAFAAQWRYNPNAAPLIEQSGDDEGERKAEAEK